jgi:uncharacterized protein DUF1996
VALRERLRPGALIVVLLLVIGLAVGFLIDRYRGEPGFVPAASDRTSRLDRDPVVPNQAGASTGSWRVDCGRNENGHRNADNVVAQPGVPHGAMHLHDYVGNVSTDAGSTDASLRSAGTTCAAGDRSTYFWPVLRVYGHGSGSPSPPVMENTGRILLPDSVLIEYLGNPASAVIPAPPFLRAVTGNARGVSQQGLNTGHVRWGCSGQPGRSTLRYPECPAGRQVVRTADYPSCWDGRRVDSRTHRAHLVFPDANGTCPADTFAVPRLHIRVTYTVPAGLDYALDTMPTERRSALTDHFDSISILPAAVTREIVACINAGRACSGS